MFGLGDATAGMPPRAFLLVIVLLLLWGYVWKAVALWYAARRDQIVWFILLVILNTVGILEIIYIFAVAPRHPDLAAFREQST